MYTCIYIFVYIRKQSVNGGGEADDVAWRTFRTEVDVAAAKDAAVRAEGQQRNKSQTPNATS